MNSENKIKIALLPILLILANCSTMSSNKDQQALDGVKSAAVVAIIEKYDASNRLATNISTGKQSTISGGTSFYEMSKDTVKTYKTFSKALAKSTGWKVKPYYDVVNHVGYKNTYDKIMPAIKVTKLPPQGKNWYITNEMMTPDALDTIGTDTRNQLAASLGVDAIIAVEVTTTAKSNWYMMGLGPRKPQSSLDFKVFKRGRPDPIWKEWIQGQKSEESAGWTGFMNEEKIRKLGNKSLRSALNRIGSDPK